jgi:GNAT superfamily N-acetyltransferase
MASMHDTLEHRPSTARAIEYRLATDRDLAALADLRWRLHMNDLPIDEVERHSRFVRDFVDIGKSDPRTGELFHWVACVDGRLVGVMSVVLVRMVPKPGELDGRWGYLTNCYVVPEMRNRAVGSSLLSAVKGWASDLKLRLLTVWPSDRAYAFYERAGFRRPADQLVLQIS